ESHTQRFRRVGGERSTGKRYERGEGQRSNEPSPSRVWSRSCGFAHCLVPFAVCGRLPAGTIIEPQRRRRSVVRLRAPAPTNGTPAARQPAHRARTPMIRFPRFVQRILVRLGLALLTFSAAAAFGQMAKLPPTPPGAAVATFAGGCFWCME